MKARVESKHGPRVGIWCLVIAGGLASAWIGFAADESSLAPASGTSTNSQPASKSQPVRLSPGLAEVLRLVKSHMDDQVTKAYINTAPNIFPPTAQELLSLKKAGVPDDLLTAILQRAAQLRPGEQPNPAVPPTVPSRAVVGPPVAAAPPSAGDLAGPNPYGYAPPPPPWPIFGPMVSFNNSFATVINGNPVYSGYYVAGYGYLW